MVYVYACVSVCMFVCLCVRECVSVYVFMSVCGSLNDYSYTMCIELYECTLAHGVVGL